MKFIKDWHFWVVLVAVLLAIVPQLQEIFPGHVLWKAVLVVLGGIAMFINQYNQKQAFVAGQVAGVTGNVDDTEA